MPLITLEEARDAASGGMSKAAAASEIANLRESNSRKSYDEAFDIFLSHSYADAQVDGEVLAGLYRMFTDRGFKVYIDWLVDRQLDRSKVDANTAEHLRKRMRQCRCLFFATSTNSSSSIWMPWELGFMDALIGKAAILPLTTAKGPANPYAGQEYLGIYPYVDKTDSVMKSIWINKSPCIFLRFQDWLSGKPFPKG